MTRTLFTQSERKPSLGQQLLAGLVLILTAFHAACDGSNQWPVDRGVDGGSTHERETVRVLGDNLVDLAAAPNVEHKYPTGLPDDFELHEVGLLNMPEGVSPYLEIDLPSDATGLGAFVLGHEDTDLIISEFVNPLGELWVSNEADEYTDAEVQMTLGFPAQFFSPARVLVSRGSATYFFPNTPDIQLIPGIHTMRLSASREGAPDDRPVVLLIAIQKRETAQNAGSLNVTFHFADGALDAASAQTDPWFQTGLETFREIYADAQIEFSHIDYVDVESDQYEVLVLEDEVCNGGALFEMFRHSIVGETDRLHIVLVDRFQCLIAGGVDIGQGMGGISGGIPGTMFSSGTAHHGVAISSQYLEDNPIRFGRVMAHEVGHFLGLFHVSERELSGVRPVTDIIEDTPVDLEQAKHNLMHYLTDDGIELTPGQQSVLLQHPLVSPIR